MRLFLAILRKAALPTATAATASTARKLPNSLPPPIRPETLVEKLFGKYLIWTNTVSCGLLLAVGDAAAQHIETRHDPPDARTPFDWRRSGIMFAVGLTQGPVQHVFYGWLDRRFVTVSRANVAKKILLDQSFMSPVAIVQFFMAAGLLEGQTFAESLAELRSKFMTVFLVSDLLVGRVAKRLWSNPLLVRLHTHAHSPTACSGRLCSLSISPSSRERTASCT